MGTELQTAMNLHPKVAKEISKKKERLRDIKKRFDHK